MINVEWQFEYINCFMFQMFRSSWSLHWLTQVSGHLNTDHTLLVCHICSMRVCGATLFRVGCRYHIRIVVNMRIRVRGVVVAAFR